MKKLPIFLSLLLLIMLAACSSNKATETPTAPINDGNILGHLTIHVDVANDISTATFTPNTSIDSQLVNLPSGVNYVSGDFQVVTTDHFAAGSKGYANVTYKFPNKVGVDKEIYLVGVNNNNTIGGSPFSKIMDYADQPITTLPTNMKLDTFYVNSGSTPTTPASGNSYVSNLNITGLTDTGGGAVLSEGFQAWLQNSPNTKVIPNNDTAFVVLSTSFDGNVTTQGPKSFNFTFILATN